MLNLIRGIELERQKFIVNDMRMETVIEVTKI